MTKAEIVRAGSGLGCRLQPDLVLLRPRRRWVSLAGAATRACLRLKGFAEAGQSRSPGVPGRLMPYTVKEIFYTLQGEGFHTGRPAVFCRFASCNLWTGRERDRHRAICQFCDTDFVGTDGVGGGHFKTAEELAAAVARPGPRQVTTHRMVVCTGGEPLLQLDDARRRRPARRGLLRRDRDQRHATGARRHRLDLRQPEDRRPLVLTSGDELKLVYPQEGGDPEQFEHLDFRSFRLSPMDGPAVRENTAAAVEYCLKRPKWRLNLQTHKYLGIP